MPKMSITKRFRPIPIAHRQPNHEGHCAYLHGHDWTLEVEITGNRDQKTGFIFDYGDFKDFRTHVLDALDHATLVPRKENGELLDPALRYLIEKDLIKPYYVPDASCEGLCQYLYLTLCEYVRSRSQGRARVCRVQLWEGDVNSSTIYADQ